MLGSRRCQTSNWEYQLAVRVLLYELGQLVLGVEILAALAAVPALVPYVVLRACPTPVRPALAVDVRRAWVM